MASVEPTRVRYAIDPAISRFTVRATASGLLSAFGHHPTIAIRDFTGEIECAETSPETASLTVKVRADRLSVQDDFSDKDRREIDRVMREEVLETARFSDIVFKSTRMAIRPIAEGRSSAEITGDLTLHGETRLLTFTAQTSLLGAMLRADGEFKLLQSDYAIKLVSVAGGALTVMDELKFAFDIVARKQA